MSGDFVWRDAGRTVVFAAGLVARAPEVLAEHGFGSTSGRGAGEFELLSTPRALAGAPELAAAATRVHEVAPGQVPDLAAGLLRGAVEVSPAMRDEAQPRSEGVPLVALGGGRVIDVAKALASVTGARVAAIPTTMSGAEMTAIHRLPVGAEDEVRSMVRPALVLADPEAMASQAEARLRASSMNALAHGVDCLYTPLANPVAEHAALRGAELIAASLGQPRDERDRADLALGSILCGYAIDSAGFGLHHVVCQTVVRTCGTPHAETNAAILPHAAAFLATRAPGPLARLADALVTDPNGLAPRIRTLAGNPAGLGTLAANEGCRDEAIKAMLRRPELANVPGPSLTKSDLAGLLAAAW